MNKLNLKDIGLDFKPEGHIHLLKGETVPGCSSIAGLFQEDGWKFAWPVKLMQQKILEGLETLGEPREKSKLDYIIDLVAKAKNAWRVKRDKSADTGTRAHKLIEEYINRTHLYEGYGPPRAIEIKDPEIKNIVHEFWKWEDKYKPEWLASEVQVGSENCKFAGILDCIAEINEKKVLLDIKTGSVKKEANIQLAGLHIALCEQGFIPEERAILHLPREGEFEYIPIESDLQKDKVAFLIGVEFYKAKNLFKGRMK